ncbi:MAG TPA: ABC transporter ATP-binding protein [Acidobacteriaceae bacterium]|jgi:ABC-2 type transport system ATP-binding protein
MSVATFSEVSEIPAAAAMADSVASLHNITKRYRNGVVALDGLSLSLRRGEIVALLGPNGAGKSTAVKLMMGLSAPTSGSVRIFQADPRHASARLRTGVMLQVGRAPETLRVREHLQIFRGYYSQPMAYDELVKIAGLQGIEERLFGQLSGGQKQRVLFALAISGDPDLVFLDEPTVGLDIESRRGMWSQIRTLASRGKTVLLTTHYLEEADALAGRIIVISKGRVVCEGTPAEVKAMGSGLHASSGTPGVPVAGVKIIRCVTTLTSEHLLAIPDVQRVESEGELTVVTTTQPEATLREMLALDLKLSGLEVQSPALEDAFLALTASPD